MGRSKLDSIGSTGGTAALGGAIITAAAIVGIYGLVNVWACLTSRDVALRVSPRQVDSVTNVPWATGTRMGTPYVLVVPRASLPSGARWMIQTGHALGPLLWAAVMVAIGLVLIRVSQSHTVFTPRVFAALNDLIVLLIVVALLPNGLVLFGTMSAVHHLAWPVKAYSDVAGPWIPLLASYVAIAFRATLSHGVELADELEQVI